MPKLKFQDFMVDDDPDLPSTPMSDMYQAKPKVISAQGLQSLQGLLDDMEERRIQRDLEDVKRSAADLVEPRVKRKYVRKAPIKPQIRKPKTFTHAGKIRGVKDKALMQALATLQALNCAYKVLTEEGKVMTHGEVPTNKTGRTRRTDREYGAIAAYYKPFIENLQVGQTVVIPFNPDIEPEDLRSSVTARMASSWGKGSYTTMFDKRKNLEIFRIR
jgi:hypothetical protein